MEGFGRELRGVFLRVGRERDFFFVGHAARLYARRDGKARSTGVRRQFLIGQGAQAPPRSFFSLLPIQPVPKRGPTTAVHFDGSPLNTAPEF